MGARRDLGGDFGKVRVHRLGVAPRHDARRALSVSGTDGAEDIGRGGSLIFRCAGARSSLGPTTGDLFFWPTRASSANQTSIALGSTPFSRPISSRRAEKLPE